MSTNPYGDHGNKDASITNPHGQGTMTPIEDTGPAVPPAPGGPPFLIGDTMTGAMARVRTSCMNAPSPWKRARSR